MTAGECVEGRRSWRTVARAVDGRDPGEGQRFVELVRLAGAAGECAESGNQAPLRLDAAVPLEIQPGQAHVLTVVKSLGQQGGGGESVDEFLVSHTNKDTTIP